MNDELLNLNENGSVPSTRVNDPIVARQIAEDVIDQNDRRVDRNTRVKGLIDGNPPYSADALARAGQKYRSNFNSGQALSFLQTSLTAYYDLFAEVPTYATIKCDSGNPDQDAQWGKILTQEFDDLQRQDPSLDYGTQLSQHEMVLYGSGPMLWEREDDWVTYPKKHDRVFLANNEPSDMNRWTKCVVREVFTPAELYRYINEPDVASKVGWDVDAVRQSILRATDEFAVYPKDWERQQQAIRNNDLEYTSPDQVVNVARLFFKEFPNKDNKEGGITEVWVNLDHDFGFLYRKVRKYKDWNQVMCPFMLDRGDGTYHSIKGIGVRMFPFLWTKERLTNSLVDNAFVMASLHLRNQQTGTATPDSMVSMGPFTIWKSNFEPMNFNGVGGAIEAASSVSSKLDSELQANLSQFRPQVAQPRGNPRTAFEVASTVNQQSVLTKTGIQRYYEQLDNWYAERFRRALTGKLNSFSDTAKAARVFRQKLAAQGVPDNVLQFCTVRATRTIGQGSHFLRTQTLQSLLGSLAGSLPEGGRENLINDFIASTAGYDMVQRYNPANRLATTLQDHEWDATQENGSMRVGNEVILTDTQNDVVHAGVHMASVAEGLAALQQGGNPQEILVYAMAVLQHTGQHLQRIANDPLRQAEFEQLRQRFEGLQDQMEELGGLLEQAQAGEQQQAMAAQEAQMVQQGMDPKTQIKQAEAQQKMSISQQRAQNEMELSRMRTEHQMRLQDALTANTIRNQNKV